ncbi:MAG: hypothetical protein M3Q51_04370, partial [Pseudomonadota bacterium]|nr:hypothetical protein [Pseudomonadota bacterium]
VITTSGEASHMKNREGFPASSSAAAGKLRERTIREHCNVMVKLEHGELQSVERIGRAAGQ